MAARGRLYPIDRLRAWFDAMPYPRMLATAYTLTLGDMTGALAADFPHQERLTDWEYTYGSGNISAEASWIGQSSTVWTATAQAVWENTDPRQRWELDLAGGGVTLVWQSDRGAEATGEAIGFLFINSTDPSILQPLAATSTRLDAEGY